jgi:UDP-N-acetylmuramyl tripeptide synthase
MDRREAIRKALNFAWNENSKTAVLITGKGTDPYIMEAHGVRTPWSDAVVTREELHKLLEKR